MQGGRLYLLPFGANVDSVPHLAMIAGSSIKYPWVLLTATFVETNVFGLLVSGSTLLFGGRYLERAWGSAEFAKLMLVVVIIPNALCYLVNNMSGWLWP